MPNIPFPDVPFYPGVPALVRGANVPVGIQVALGDVQTLLASALQQSQQWGIFDSNGNQLGLTPGIGPNGISQSVAAFVLGSSVPLLSTNAFELTKETKIADFPIEQGSFATYNKVILAQDPVVTMVLQGSVADRSVFLNALNAACNSTALYTIATPEVTYLNYSLERMNVSRRAERGATLIIVEITLKEIRQVSAAYSSVPTPINQPQNPAATPQTNSGLVQTQPPPTSVLKSAMNLFPSLGSN